MRQAIALSERGALEAAAAIARQACELAGRESGTTSAVYANSLAVLATVLRRAGDSQSALGILESALDVGRNGANAAPELLIWILQSLAELREELGDLARARDARRAVLQLTRALGDDAQPFAYSAAASRLALVCERAGDFVEAERLYRDALAALRAGGAPANDVASALNNLGLGLHRGGRSAEAEQVLLEAVQLHRGTATAEPAAFAIALSNLGLVALETGAASRAIEPLLEAASVWRSAEIEMDLSRATTLRLLGLAYHALGEPGKGELLERRALDMRRAMLGEQHIDVSKSLADLAGTYQATGDLFAAETCYRDALAIRHAARAVADRDFGVLCSNLAGLYANMGNYGDAAEFYGQALEVLRRALGATHSLVAYVARAADEVERDAHVERGEIAVESASAAFSLGGGQ